jgi:hypothetical protein
LCIAWSFGVEVDQEHDVKLLDDCMGEDDDTIHRDETVGSDFKEVMLTV